MTALTHFCFGKHTLRPAGAQLGDIRIAQNWTAKDKDHLTVPPTFWLEQRPGIDSYILEDRKGPIFFFKTVLMIRYPKNIRAVPRTYGEEVVELHIQFMPRESEEDYQRTRDGLIEGYRWLEEVLKGNAVKEVFFDSRDFRLIAFCVRRLGFEQKGERVFKRLSSVEANAPRG